MVISANFCCVEPAALNPASKKVRVAARIELTLPFSPNITVSYVEIVEANSETLWLRAAGLKRLKTWPILSAV